MVTSVGMHLYHLVIGGGQTGCRIEQPDNLGIELFRKPQNFR